MLDAVGSGGHRSEEDEAMDAFVLGRFEDTEDHGGELDEFNEGYPEQRHMSLVVLLSPSVTLVTPLLRMANNTI